MSKSTPSTYSRTTATFGWHKAFSEFAPFDLLVALIQDSFEILLWSGFALPGKIARSEAAVGKRRRAYTLKLLGSRSLRPNFALSSGHLVVAELCACLMAPSAPC
jgi:hypothetical protein